MPTPSATDLRQRVAAAEADLRSGEFEATLAQGATPRSRATIRFEFGGGAGLSRLHLSTTYQGAKTTQTTELLIIGERAWRRQDGGTWMPSASAVVFDQVQAYLPRSSAAQNVTMVQSGTQQTELRWYDAARNADVTLTVDPQTGIPLQLRQVTRGDGQTFTVSYRQWNAPVQISPP